jgi:DNA-binding protein H-NS
MTTLQTNGTKDKAPPPAPAGKGDGAQHPPPAPEPPPPADALPVDLAGMPDAVLATLAVAVPREIAARQAKREADLFAEFRERARALGVTPLRLAAALGLKLSGGAPRPSLLRPASVPPDATGADDGRRTVRPKYWSKDRTQRWSGRGGRPQWVLDHLAAGGTLEELAIDGEAAQPEGEGREP